MTVFEKLLSFLGFSKLIKIPGKSDFNDLTGAEVAAMIDAFLDGTNDQFDELAFNDFLHTRLKNDELLWLQRELNKNAFIPRAGETMPEINVQYLRTLSKRLKEGAVNICRS